MTTNSWAGAAAVLGLSALAAGGVVHAGWDLLQTHTGTHFMGIPLQGVPLGMHDFGGPIGPRNVGGTDTIVQRLGDATVFPAPGTDVVPIEIVALHLQSVQPISLTPFGGTGTDWIYVTLQSERGGPQSPGQMQIHFSDDNGGTFDSFFDVFFDIRVGDVNGPIVMSSNLQMAAQNVPWGRTAPTDALRLSGVNDVLNGTDTSNDFWPGGEFTEAHPGGLGLHVVGSAVVPLPTGSLLAIGGLLLGASARRR